MRRTASALAIIALTAWSLSALAQDANAPPLTEMAPAPSGLQPLAPATDTDQPSAQTETAAPSPDVSSSTPAPAATDTSPPPAPTPPVIAAPAAPPTPVETAVRGWIAAIDASPDWSASVQAVRVDISGKATLSNVAISADKPGFTIVIGGITIDGYAAGAANTFSARQIDVTNARIDAGDYSVRIDHAAIMAPTLPTSGGARWDDAQPIASLVSLATAALAASVQSATADKVTVVETVSDIQSWSTYANVKVTDFAGGKISALTAGPLRSNSPGSDPAGPPPDASQLPLVSLSVANAETHDIDLAAMLVPFTARAGDTGWHQAIGRVVYSGVGIDVPGIAAKIDDVAFENLIVRRPTVVAPPTPSDPTAVSPADMVRGAAAVLSPFGVGRMVMDKLTVTGTGLDDVHIGNMTLVDASLDSIGSFSLSDIGGAISGQGKVSIGRIAFGGLKLPSFDTIADVLATALAGGDAKYSSAVPTLDYGEVAGIDVALGGLEMKLGRLRADLGQWVDKIPTKIGVALAALDVPAALIPSEPAQRLLAQYGYDDVQLDGGGALTWGGDGTIAIRDASLAMKDAGGVSGQADLVGIAPADAEHMAVAENLLGKLSLKAGSATLTDASLAERLLAAQAAKLNVNGETFRAQFAKSVPFMLMLLGNRDLIMKVSPVIQTFLTTGGSVTAVAAPSAPVPLSQVADTAKSSPWSLFSLLNVDLTGVAGTATTLPSLPTPPPATAAAATPPADRSDSEAEP